MKTKTTLNALYSFPGFRARSRLKGILGDAPARIITLKRRQKKLFAQPAAPYIMAITTSSFSVCATYPPATPASTWSLNTAESAAARARP